MNQLVRENSAGVVAQQHYDFLQPHLEAIRSELMRQWLDTKPEAALRRENIWRELHCLKTLETRITSIIATGKMAKVELNKG